MKTKNCNSINTHSNELKLHQAQPLILNAQSLQGGQINFSFCRNLKATITKGYLWSNALLSNEKLSGQQDLTAKYFAMNNLQGKTPVSSNGNLWPEATHRVTVSLQHPSCIEHPWIFEVLKGLSVLLDA